MTNTLSHHERPGYDGFIGNFDLLDAGVPAQTEQQDRLPTERVGAAPAPVESGSFTGDLGDVLAGLDTMPHQGDFSGDLSSAMGNSTPEKDNLGGNLLSGQATSAEEQAKHDAKEQEKQQLLLYSLKLRDPGAFREAFNKLDPHAKGRFDAFEAREDAHIKDKVPAAAKFITKLSTGGQTFIQPERIDYDNGGFYTRGLLDRELLDKNDKK